MQGNQTRVIGAPLGNQLAGIGSAPSTCEARQPEIQEKLAGAFGHLVELERAVTNIEERFAGVLSPVEVGNANIAGAPTRTEIGGQLDSINYRIYLVTCALQSVLNRAEL